MAQPSAGEYDQDLAYSTTWTNNTLTITDGSTISSGTLTYDYNIHSVPAQGVDWGVTYVADPPEKEAAGPEDPLDWLDRRVKEICDRWH